MVGVVPRAPSSTIDTCTVVAEGIDRVRMTRPSASPEREWSQALANTSLARSTTSSDQSGTVPSRRARSARRSARTQEVWTRSPG
ncbi:hypothetical protein [Nocardiopsis lucentensis]|uniref:hypothetical protein n=1 Tax=Nocardiopsis lucentensis TaxID=53441 RepID=UPI00037CA0C8